MARKYITAPAYFRFFYDTPDEIIITPADQMNASTVTFTETFSDQMSQASTSRADAVSSGLTVEAQVSIASVGNFDLFKALFNGSDDLTEGQRKLIGVAARPGCPVKKSSIMIKLADCDGESIDPFDWFFLPNAAFFTTDTSFNFSNTDQASYNITVAAFDPEPDSIWYPYKVLRGDIGVINGDPAPPTGGTPTPAPTFNTILTSTSDTAAGVTMVGADAGTEFRFNSIASPTGTAISMDIFVAGTQRAAINTVTAYNGQPFRFLYSGTLYQGSFADGTVNVTAA